MKSIATILRKYKNEKKYNLNLALILVNYSANGIEITSYISGNITQDSYISANRTVGLSSDISIEPGAKLRLFNCSKLIINKDFKMIIKPNAILRIGQDYPWETPDIFEYQKSEWPTQFSTEEHAHNSAMGGIFCQYIDGTFCYNLEGDTYKRVCKWKIAPVGKSLSDIGKTLETSLTFQFRENEAIFFCGTLNFYKSKKVDGVWQTPTIYGYYGFISNSQIINGNEKTGLYFFKSYFANYFVGNQEEEA